MQRDQKTLVPLRVARASQRIYSLEMQPMEPDVERQARELTPPTFLTEIHLFALL